METDFTIYNTQRDAMRLIPASPFGSVRSACQAMQSLRRVAHGTQFANRCRK